MSEPGIAVVQIVLALVCAPLLPGIINRVPPAATGAVTLLLDSKAHGNSRYGIARLFEK